ncbi:MAG: EAL domain-containing protein [Methylobacterium mesophilicum]|nr:EAL domain-containing protein [Methylobacterium mesophilicum]
MLAAVVYVKTDAPAYLAIALAFLFVGILRLLAIRKVLLSPPLTTRVEASRRERVYIFWGALHAFLLGMFCFTAIYIAPDTFAESAAICVTLASATSIVGRNYGSPRLVMVQIIALVSPFSLAYLLRGDVYHVILGLCSIPFLYAIRNFAKVVRDVLYSALSEERKAAWLAQRFNRALNTMSHGLVMLGPDGKVVVANAEAARLMELASPEKLLGRSIHALLKRGVAGERLAARDCRFIEAQLTRALKEGRSRKVLVSLTNGQHYEFSAREGSQELGVITFEEVTARISAEEKIRNMARFDSLTGLANRAYFNELVSELMTSGDPDRLCAFAMLDLDDFKNINDTLGHPVGDGLIAALSERLMAFSSDRVTISRFGGDEFMLFIDNLIDELELTSMLNEIFASLQGEVDVMGHSLRIQTSGGAVTSRVGDTDAGAMIMRADLALYKAKEEGKGRWKLFVPVMDAAFRDKQLLKADLRTAVEMRQLRVVYQPIIALNSMRIASCEALCRWDHPELGPISPATFIPLAEEMGIISQISAFVLDSAAGECARWPEPISVSVNLSAKDFRNIDIVEKVRSVLQRHKLAPARLEIEITETALLDDKSLTRTAIESIKSLGVQIALDDFGTGYSSLSYLHNLPFDKVKIDRSFLRDISVNPRTLELVKGVVGLSRLLGLQITVEGVETFEQLKALSREVKPDLVQGFLFGAALSASGITTMSTAVWPFAEHLGSLRAPAAN